MQILDRHPPLEGTQSAPDPEALIREAKQRERRRRIILTLSVVFVLGAVAAVVGIADGAGGNGHPATSNPKRGPAGAESSRSSKAAATQPWSPALYEGFGFRYTADRQRMIVTYSFTLNNGPPFAVLVREVGTSEPGLAFIRPPDWKKPVRIGVNGHAWVTLTFHVTDCSAISNQQLGLHLEVRRVSGGSWDYAWISLMGKGNVPWQRVLAVKRLPEVGN